MRVVNCVPIVPNGSVTVMARGIGKALRQLHHEVWDFDYRPGEDAPAVFRDMLDWLADAPDVGVLIDINGAVATSTPAIEAARRAGPVLSFFTLMTDNPTYYPSRLERWPSRATIGVIDRSFVDTARVMKFNRPAFVFCPHAGDEPMDDPLPASRRDIDYLFIGNVSYVPSPDHHAREAFADAPSRAALFLASHERMTGDTTPFEVVVKVARQSKYRYRLKDLALVANALEQYLSNAARANALDRLSGLPVTVVGSIADGVIKEAGAFDQLGFVPFSDCLGLMERSKVVLNVRPGFVNGAHERTFYALSRGAAVLCDGSRYLEIDREEHGYVEFFDRTHDDLRDSLVTLRAFREATEPDVMINSYGTRHTWRRRLSTIEAISGSRQQA